MSAPTADRIVHDARIGPSDTPHEAAAHLWAQVVANHDVAADGPLAQLGLFERVVLVLQDVLGLSTSTVAEVLHSEEAAVASAHANARSRMGLPRARAVECRTWNRVITAHSPGDPAVLDDLVAHTAECPTCSGARDDNGAHRRRAAGAAGAVAAGTAVAAPALGGTLAAAAAIVAAGVAVGALVGPVPEQPLPDPVVVDAEPALPSDQEPPAGWPTEPPAGTEAGTDATVGDGAAVDGDPADAATDDNGAQDTTGTVTDTLDETTDELDDTVDEVTDAVTDTTDELDDTTSTTGDALDDAVVGTTDTADDTAEVLP